MKKKKLYKNNQIEKRNRLNSVIHLLAYYLFRFIFSLACLHWFRVKLLSLGSVCLVKKSSQSLYQLLWNFALSARFEELNVIFDSGATSIERI